MTGSLGIDDSPYKDEDYFSEGDEIVKEIPVYFSEQLAQHLYLFQHPIRTRAYTPETAPIAARIKPKAQMIELDLPMNKNSATYDEEKGRDLGLAFSDKKVKTVYNLSNSADDDEASEVPSIEKQTLSSTMIPAKAKYMVGIIKDDELHLTEINSTIQFRPSLSYLDIIDDKVKAANKRVVEEEKKSRGEEAKGRGVQMSLGRVESADMEQAKKNSISWLRKQAQEEAWLNLEYFDETTEEANVVFDRLFASHRDELKFNETPRSYLENISPPPAMNATVSADAMNIKPGVHPRADLAILGVETQIKAVLMNAHILPLKKIQSFLDPPLSEVDILNKLEQYAVLVHGNWVVKSELLYKYTDRKLFARDYLISLFQQSTANPAEVSRAEFVAASKLLNHDTKLLLEQLSTLDIETKMWRLKCRDDDNFVQEYPDVVSSQRKMFEKPLHHAKEGLGLIPMSKELTRIINRAKKAQPGSIEDPILVKSEPSVKRERKDSKTGKQKTVIHRIQDVIVSSLRKEGVMKKEQLIEEIKQKVIDANEEQIESKLSTHTVMVQDRLVLKSVPPYDDYRNIILNLFRAKSTIKKNDVIKACKAAIGDSIPVKMFNPIMRELSNEVKTSTYVLKTL